MYAPRLLILLAAAAVAAIGGPLTPLFSNPDGEPTLTTTLDSIYGAGGYTRISDDSDQFWAGQASVSAIAISSYAGAIQRFGFCVACDGSDDTMFDPAVHGDGVFTQVLTVNGLSSVEISDPLFRFFNDPTQHYAVGRVYSDPSLNPAGADHMVTFSVNGHPNRFVLGFEDWLFTSDPASDRDYNDLVLEVSFLRSDVQTAPEPGTALLVGCGLLLAARIGRKRMRR